MEIKINDTREGNFYIDALRFILKKSGEKHILVFDEIISSQARNVANVEAGNLDILYAGTSLELEEKLLPIRFPIMRGLVGRRIFIINTNNQSLFEAVKKLDDLKKLTGIQGIGWGDTTVLETSGLKILTSQYDKIFELINAGRTLYFPRGITEIYAEIKSKNAIHPNLVVEKNLLLTYPLAVFFFVSHSNTELAEILILGFTKSYEDGSYLQFFYDHPVIKSALVQADMKNRIKIEIPNPYLSTKTSDISSKYWHKD